MKYIDVWYEQVYFLNMFLFLRFKLKVNKVQVFLYQSDKYKTKVKYDNLKVVAFSVSALSILSWIPEVKI